VSANLRRVFASLHYPYFRNFFLAQNVVMVGGWLQSSAVLWLVYRLTQDPLLLGLCAFLGQLPVFLLTPFAGVLSDRFNKKVLLRFYVLGTTTFSLLLTIAAWRQIEFVPVYFLLNSCLGVVSGLDMSVRQSMVSELVPDKKHISNALSLFSMSNHCSRIISFALFGLIIKFYGETGCFFGNTLCALAMFFVLTSIPSTEVYQPDDNVHTMSFWQSFLDGARYMYTDKAMRSLVTMIIGMSMIGMSYTVTLPVLAQEVFHGDASTFGWLMTGVSLGSLTAAVQLAYRRNILNLEQSIVQAGLLWGAMYLLVAFNKILWLNWLFLILLGHGMVVQFGSNIIMQTLVQPRYRGRLVSFYILAFHGMLPFGSLLVGRLTAWLGSQLTLFFCGLFCLGVMGWFARRQGLVAVKIKTHAS
jgi:MFS family permease